VGDKKGQLSPTQIEMLADWLRGDWYEPAKIAGGEAQAQAQGGSAAPTAGAAEPAESVAPEAQVPSASEPVSEPTETEPAATEPPTEATPQESPADTPPATAEPSPPEPAPSADTPPGASS
jgi:hypothetical protein